MGTTRFWGQGGRVLLPCVLVLSQMGLQPTQVLSMNRTVEARHLKLRPDQLAAQRVVSGPKLVLVARLDPIVSVLSLSADQLPIERLLVRFRFAAQRVVHEFRSLHSVE